MELTEGSQVLLSGRAAVVISVTPFPDCAVIVLLWPATTRPPEDSGLRRPGTWQTKCVHLLKPTDGPYLWDLGQPARITLNTEPSTFVNLNEWMAAFAARCRA